LESVSFQGAAGYGKINKTGACPYVLALCNRDVVNDALTGTRISGAFVMK
jgi:hypothetical protein